MRSTKGVVTVTKGERRRSRKVRGRNETENDSVVGGKRARRGIQREKAKERERRRRKREKASSAKSRTRGDDFRERGLRDSPRRSTASPSSTVPAAARIFLPLSGPLSQSSSFFSAGPPSRRARFSPPRTASIFLFERLRGHAPAPQWPRARKFVAGAAPFPATPASFSPVSLALQPSFSRTLGSLLPASASAAPLHFFLSPFLVFFRPDHPSRAPSPILLPPLTTAAVDVDVDPASAVSVSLARSPLSSASPPGVYFKRSLEPPRSL